MTLNIDEFKATLAGCSSELVETYLQACEAELEIRKSREAEKIKETLKNLDKAQLKAMFLDLGLDFSLETAAPVTEKKTRNKRSVIPHGYKEYAVADATYYVAPFFNPELSKTSKGVKAGWLEPLSSEERQEQFGTIHLLTAGQISLTDLVEADPEAVQIIAGETMQLVTRAMLADTNPPETPAKAGKKGAHKNANP